MHQNYKYYIVITISIFLISFLLVGCYPVKVIVVDADKPIKVEVVNTVNTTSEKNEILTCEIGYEKSDAHWPCVIHSLSKEVEVLRDEEGKGSIVVGKMGPFQNLNYPLGKNEWLRYLSNSNEKVHCEYSRK